MMHIVVYYGNPADIRVSIDGTPSVDTRTALNQIVDEKQTQVNCDPFGPWFTYDGFKPNSPLFDWETITERELEVRLTANLLSSGLNKYLCDPVIDIKCIKGKSP